MDYKTKKLTKEELEKLEKAELIKLILEKNKTTINEKNVASSAESIFNHIKKIKIDKEREHFILIMLTSQLEITSKKVMFAGDVDRISDIYVKVLLRECFQSKRAVPKIIVAHNHPSGNTEPSQSDISFTTHLKKCCKLMDIELLDHITFSGKNYLSMKERNYI